jgi:hypothetical protein
MPSSASRAFVCTGTPSASPPSASPRSRPAADRLTAERSVRSRASNTAGTRARPVQPVAPAMHTDKPSVCGKVQPFIVGETRSVIIADVEHLHLGERAGLRASTRSRAGQSPA